MEPRADVLIVTVTKAESQSVLRAFEGATGHEARPISIADRVYHDLGQVNGARVFMALSEMGAGGLGASQQAVQKGIAALRPGAVIMVGIAFGVNAEKQATGDVLISRQLMLYDLQRIGVSAIIPRGDRPHASPWLLNHLQSASLRWDTAQVHFGLVLTGEKLIDDIDYRSQLQKLESEAIGGEMEGAGLYVACHDAKVDWILVKAICDWADGNKAKDKDARQRLAADNAAAFVLHALRHAPLTRTQSAITSTQLPFSAAQEADKLPLERPHLRDHLDHILPTASDFDAFVGDYFPEIYRKFSIGMSRMDRTTFLLQSIEPAIIAGMLQIYKTTRQQ